jgi:ATP-dependent Clp endopeptidase proteolytic subunit ClpP
MKKAAAEELATSDLASMACVSPIDMFSLASYATYMYFDDVTQDSSRDLVEFLIKSNFVFSTDTTLSLLINSYGGDVHAGFAAIDAMEVSRLEIQTVGIGAICSMAALMFVSGTPGKRIMSRNAFIMTHHFSEGVEGTYHDFIAMRKTQDIMHKRFVDHFVKRTKMTEQQVKDILLSPTDRWITAQEALELGLCDIIRDPWETPPDAPSVLA